jgi:CheY-like chemotaxis protein
MAKVLVVEDTEVNRIMLSQRLEKRGYDVVLAVDGEEGVAKATEDAPDIVLLDMNLPKMDGLEVLQALKQSEETKHIPIIALTAHSITKTRDAAIDAGCDEYETKPVDFERLIHKMEDLMDQAG